MSKDLQPKMTLPVASESLPARSQKDLDKLMMGYKTILKEMNELLLPWENSNLEEDDIPAGNALLDELQLFPRVFEFMACRRSTLRSHLYGGRGLRVGSQGADRADEVLGMYHTLVVRVDLPEAPENWTLRNKPDVLKEYLSGLVEDLMHLAKEENISWREIMRVARESYQVNVMDDLDGSER